MRAGEEGRGREGCSCLRLGSQEGCGISTARSGNESPEKPQLMGPRALGKGWLKGLPGLSSCLPLCRQQDALVQQGKPGIQEPRD